METNRICVIEDCEATSHKKGYCKKHYFRLRRNGDPFQKKLHQESHGFTGTGTYNCWQNMWKRCLNPNHPWFYRYGGRGISVCERWRSFNNFLEDMGEKPEGCSIERLNNDWGYCPDNCVWSYPKQQSRNTGKPASNSSGVKGVSFHKGNDRWLAHIGVDGKTITLGYFHSVKEASEARRQGEIDYWGGGGGEKRWVNDCYGHQRWPNSSR